MSESTAPLIAGSALAGLILPGADAIARLTAAVTLGRLVLRADVGIARQIGIAIGLALDTPVNRAAVGESCATLRLGPDEWLVLADAERDPWLSARIGGAAEGAPHALVDVSHRSTGLLLEGPQVEAVLAAGCALPLDTAAFPVNRATRTLLGKAEIVLWRRAADRFHIEVAASFTPYVVSLLHQTIADEAALAKLALD